MPLIFSRAPDLEKEEDCVATEFAPHGIDTARNAGPGSEQKNGQHGLKRPPSDMERNKEDASNKRRNKRAGFNKSSSKSSFNGPDLNSQLNTGGSNSRYATELSIRNGTVVDPTGVLAVRLLSTQSLPHYALPFSRLVIGTVPYRADLPLHLSLAAINASLVGVALLDPSSNNTDGNQLRRQALHYTPPSQEDSSGDVLGAAFKPGKQFELAAIDRQLPTIGVGIVRAVDLEQQRLVLLFPSHCLAMERICDDSSNKISVVLYKGASSYSIPTQLQYGPALPCYPYMSSESSGEGSSQMKSRNNIKRRSQNVN